MALETYRKKRNFSTTPEPEGRMVKRGASGLAFVIQKHRASHLHYDFRLELNGVLLSWAVPKGPSLDPADKRLAMHVEDHPIAYGGFEGVIPPKQYGSGTVLLWDRGSWVPFDDPQEGYRKGKLKFTLEGEKLHGYWTLVRGWGAKKDEQKAWFLIKGNDEYAERGAETPVVDRLPRSVASGRDLDEIAADPDRVWHSNKSFAENVRTGTVKKKKPTLALAQVKGAKKGPMPETVAPELATLAKVPPMGDEWVHEIKYDGYRMVCRVTKGEAQMFSRNGKEWTTQFAPIARALARLPVREAWCDGEVVVMQADGRTSFQALQNVLSAGDSGALAFWLFDLPYLDGYDLRGAPLLERKRVLRELLQGQPAPLQFSEHLEGSGEEVFAQACKLRLEGIVSKRRDSTYQARRGTDWLKVKCAMRQEMVIGGYTEPGGSRTGFGALLMGVYDGQGALRYCGKVGTGFNQSLLDTLSARLKKLEQRAPAFANPPRGYEARGAHWIKPELVAEIAFTEWTHDGTARHPSFQGLRADKVAREVVLEMPVAASTKERAGEPVDQALHASVEEQNEEPDDAPIESEDLRKRGAATKGAGKKSAIKKSAIKNTVVKKIAFEKTAADKSTVNKTATSKSSRNKSAVAAPTAETASMSPASAPKSASKLPAGPSVIAGITISHPDKVLYPESGITKGEIGRYYEAVGEWMLPQLRDRPLTLVRCPSGWEKSCFYQKHVDQRVPAVIERVQVQESAGPAIYTMANSVPAIVALLQMGVLEIHPWGSTRRHLNRPDRLIFDFDPDEDLGWDRIVEAVELLRTLLENLGLRGYLRTTGGKGLHVVVPVKPTHEWDVIKPFTKAIADLMVTAFPDRFTSKLAKARRGGKIFVDYLRNAEGSTAIASYSVRAKARAPVATPIAWKEIAADVRFDHFTIRNVPKRLSTLTQDPWADMIKNRQEITAELMQKLGLRKR